MNKVLLDHTRGYVYLFSVFSRANNRILFNISIHISIKILHKMSLSIRQKQYYNHQLIFVEVKPT